MRRASKAGVFLPDDLADQLVSYYELLERWNRKINLTALDDPDAAIDRLLLEPVVAARHLPQGPINLIDVGSGGGSPALPLALAGGARVTLTMVEAKARKSAFLREAVRHLELSTATVENSRYEDLLARPELHEQFDVMSVRAVRVESKLLMSLQAFIKPRGSLLLFRGPSGRDEPSLMPPLEWHATVPLVESLRSRLSLVIKRSTSSGVPRLAS
ncbi:MAG TPA: 16S rRNA (guanine(527)-N(7))-methyltransferase RsmG [Vicinamibacterales bacterium]|nr:16S rRNA (guanine(527)-N(7))-methyltransferase RsmG [Vicinamibacterales bacterium]